MHWERSMLAEICIVAPELGMLLPNSRFSITGNMGFYGGASALAFQGVALVSKNFAVSGGAAFNVSGGSKAATGRVGVTIGW